MSTGGRQAQTGTLDGTVTDQQGEPLPGVTVTASGASSGERVEVTNAEGWFRFLGVAPGIYTVDAMLEGFSTVRHSNVDVQVERTTTLSIQMAAEIIE